MSDDGTENADESFLSATYENSPRPQTPVTSESKLRQRPPKRIRQSSSEQIALTNEVLLSVKDHFKRPRTQEDRFDVYGKNVAMKMRDLAKLQRILAEKIINDVLSEAEMGNLSASHRLICQTQPQHQSFRMIPPTPLHYPQTLY